MSKVNNLEWILERTHEFLDRHWKTGLGLAFTVLLTEFLTAVYSLPTLNEVLQYLYNSQAKALNYLSWLATGAVIIFPATKFVLGRYVQSRNYAVRLAEIYRDKVDSFLKPYQRGRLAWGPELVLQTCPNLHAGWSLSEVQIRYVQTRYTLPPELQSPYGQFFVENLSRGRFKDNKVSLMLTQNPIAFSDSPSLTLDIQETLYSEVQFFKQNIATLAEQRIFFINEAINGNIRFPNSLCLHMTVVTSDGYLLLTQRSDKVDYFRGAWSCSVEEQLTLDDLRGPEKDFAKNWGERLLWEELGVGPDGYNLANLRVFAVFIESDVLNCSLAGITVLKHDRRTLDAIIDKHPRTDYEFQKWDFIGWDAIPRELHEPTRTYHPSSGLRLFIAGIYKFGAPGLGNQLYALGR